MMKLYYALFLCLPVFSSFVAQAQCSTPGKFQTMTIAPDTKGQPVVDDKGSDQQCVVLNNKHPDRQKTSHIKWVFKNLNCTHERCRIEVLNQPAMPEGAYECHPDKPNYFVCTLRVHKAKGFCPAIHDYQADCKVDYNIWVGDQKIDPSIIIRPRPAI